MSASSTASNASNPPQYRPLHFGVTRAVLTEGQGGARYSRCSPAPSA